MSEKIAVALQVTLADVLVSPELGDAKEQQRKMIQQAVEAALNNFYAVPRAPTHQYGPDACGTQ